jgi:uncharacterized protein (DUF58 family)
MPAIRRMRRNSSRSLTALGGRLLGAGLMLTGLGQAVRSPVLFGAGVFAAALPIACLLLLPAPRVVLEMAVARPLRVGVPTVVTLRARNAGRGRSPGVQLRFGSPLLAIRETAVEPLAAGETAVRELAAVGWHRGTATSLPVVVLARDGLGLTLRRDLAVVPVPLGVAPRVVVPPAVELASRTGTAMASSPCLPIGGSEPGDLRSWRPGDGRGRIAWRATARRAGTGRGGPVVRPWMGTDPEHLVLGAVAGSGSLEPTLEVLAALACAAVIRGQRVTLRLGVRSVTAGRSEPLLEALAAVVDLPALPPPGCDVVIGPTGGGRAGPLASGAGVLR